MKIIISNENIIQEFKHKIILDGLTCRKNQTLNKSIGNSADW